jgi:hypothetical protein
MFCEGVVASIVCMSSTTSQNSSAGASLADSSAMAMSATMPAVSAPAASVQLGRVRAAFTRRNFLKVGLGGAAVLAVLRVAHGPYLPVVTPAVAAGVQAHKLAVLSAHEAAVLAAIAPVVWTARSQACRCRCKPRCMTCSTCWALPRHAGWPQVCESRGTKPRLKIFRRFSRAGVFRASGSCRRAITRCMN